MRRVTRLFIPASAQMLAIVGVCTFTDATSAQSCGWQEFPEGGPGIRSGARLVYDNSRDRVLLWGGYKGNGDWPSDLWAWTGAEWVMIDDGQALNTPEGRLGHCMVFDSWRNELVLFGGGRGGPPDIFYDETWVWRPLPDGGEWILLDDGTNGPTPRWSGAMAFDSARGESVLFGGTPDANSLMADTWIWDGGGWQLIDTGSVHPTARDNSAMTYDTRDDLAILFGGFDDPPDRCDSSRTNDTWAWDGTSRSWSLLHDGSGIDVPGVRNGHGLAYDAARGVVVLFGGHTCGTDYTQTWEWTTASRVWKLRADHGPPGRTGLGMVYDTARAETVVHGGANDLGDQYPQTWTWSGRIAADFNLDDAIDTRDVIAFLNAWSAGCP